MQTIELVSAYFDHLDGSPELNMQLALDIMPTDAGPSEALTIAMAASFTHATDLAECRQHLLYVSRQLAKVAENVAKFIDDSAGS